MQQPLGNGTNEPLKITLDELLEKYDLPLDDIPSLEITTEALVKANIYGEIANELAGSEVFGYLTFPFGAKRVIVQDAFLGLDQIVKPGHCDLSPRSSYDTQMQIQKEGNALAGWWHSHKPVSLGSHSDDDDDNFRREMNYIFTYNKTNVPAQIRPSGNNLYEVRFENPWNWIGLFFNEPKRNSFLVPTSDLAYLSLQGQSGWMRTEVKLETAYSLIVRKRQERPYVEIAFRNPFPKASGIQSNILIFEGMGIRHSDINDFLLTPDVKLEEQIRAYEREVRERVRPYGQHITKFLSNEKVQLIKNVSDWLHTPGTDQVPPKKFGKPEDYKVQKKSPIRHDARPGIISVLTTLTKPRDYQSELEAYQATHTYTNEQYESLQHRVSELEQRVSQSTASQQAQLQQKDSELARQRELTRQEKINYATRIKEGVRRILEARKRKTAARESELTSQVRQQIEAEYADRLEARDKALQESEAQRRVLEERLTPLNQHVTSLTQTVQDYEQREQQYQQRLTIVEQRATAAEQQLSAANQSSSQAAQGYQRRLTSLEQKVSAAEQARDRAQATASESERKAREYETTIRRKDEEIERLKSEKGTSLFSKIKNATKTILGYSPVVGALMKKDEVVDKATKTLESKIQNGKINGKELYEIMYSSGVNNTATQNAVKKKLEEKGVSIEGKVESKYVAQSKVVDFINSIGIGKFKIGNIGDGLQIYRGENSSKWDAFRRNTKIGGEVSALMQGTALATFGYSLYQGASAASHALEDRLKDTKYNGIASQPLGWATGVLGLSAAINSGNLTALARSSNNIYSQSSGLVSRGLGKLAKYLKHEETGVKAGLGNYLEKIVHHNDKVAYLSQLAGQGFMLGTMADVAYAQYHQGTAILREPTTKQETATPQDATKQPDYKHPDAGEHKPAYESSQPKEHVVQPQETHPTAPTTATYTPQHDFTSSQLDELSHTGWHYVGDGKFEYKISAEDHRFGRGISQILRHSDSSIGNDAIMSNKESGILAHQVAITPPSEVSHIGNGTFTDLRNSHKYVVHQGDKLYATSDVVKTFFK